MSLVDCPKPSRVEEERAYPVLHENGCTVSSFRDPITNVLYERFQYEDGREKWCRLDDD